MSAGGELQAVNLRTGESSGTQTFAGVGDGRWNEIRNDPRGKNGRLKIIHTRAAGPSSGDIVQ